MATFTHWCLCPPERAIGTNAIKSESLPHPPPGMEISERKNFFATTENRTNFRWSSLPWPSQCHVTVRLVLSRSRNSPVKTAVRLLGIQLPELLLPATYVTSCSAEGQVCLVSLSTSGKLILLRYTLFCKKRNSLCARYEGA